MNEDRQERFTAYGEALAGVIGHADRAAPLRDYCRGLLLPGDGKSVEPIAAVTAPARVSAKHQSLLHFVANAPWLNERVLGRIQELTVPIIEGSGAIEAWIIAATGFPKKGRYGTVAKLGDRRPPPLADADRWRLGSAARSRCRACRCRRRSGLGAAGRPHAGTSASAATWPCAGCPRKLAVPS